MERVELGGDRYITELTITPVIQEEWGDQEDGGKTVIAYMSLPDSKDRIAVGTRIDAEVVRRGLDERFIERIRHEHHRAIARHLSAPWDEGGRAFAMRHVSKEAVEAA